MPEPRLLPEIRADLAQLAASKATPEEVVRLLTDVGPLCNAVEQLRLHVTEPDRLRWERDRPATEARIDRLAATVRKLAGWAGHDIADLVDEGYLQDGDLAAELPNPLPPAPEMEFTNDYAEPDAGGDLG